MVKNVGYWVKTSQNSWKFWFYEVKINVSKVKISEISVNISQHFGSNGHNWSKIYSMKSKLVKNRENFVEFCFVRSKLVKINGSKVKKSRKMSEISVF